MLRTPIQIIIHLPTTGNYPISIFVGSCKVDNFFSATITGIFSDDYRYFWQIWDQPQVQVHRSGFHRGGQDSEQVPVDRQDEKL